MARETRIFSYRASKDKVVSVYIGTGASVRPG